jgi:hypothetical protein
MGWRVSAIGEGRDGCPGSILSNKSNTCFEIHTQLEVHIRGVFFSISLTFCGEEEKPRDSAAGSSETSVHIYHTTRRHVPGDGDLHDQRHESIIAHLILLFIFSFYILFYFTFFLFITLTLLL